jgi:hypothetical protein
MSPGGVLFAAAPTLSSISWTPISIAKLRFLGVNQVVSAIPLPSITISPDSSEISAYFGPEAKTATAALSTLAQVYNQRFDLQRAFPPGPTLGENLLRWARIWGITKDSARGVLKGFSQFFSQTYSKSKLLATVPIFTVHRLLPKPEVVRGDKTVAYVYTLSRHPFVMWIPKAFVSDPTGSFWQLVGNHSLPQLSEDAFIQGFYRNLARRPATLVRLVKYQPGTEFTTVAAIMFAGGLVVLRITPEQGEHITVNGRPTRWIPIDGGLFTGITVPKGPVLIKIDYLNTPLSISLWISITMTLFLVVSLLVLGFYTISKWGAGQVQ